MPRTARRSRYVAATAAGVLAIGSVVVVSQLPAAAASAVTINGATAYQRIDGFGISEAFGQANAIRSLSGAPQRQALDMLFSPTSGAGFSILRSLIPSDAAHTMMSNAPASPSASPTYVWNGSNDATDWGQLWLAKQARTYGVTNFYNDAWSAPGFMKTNKSEANGGALCGTPGASCGSGDWRRAYANYLTQHAKNWASVGLTPSHVGFVNEPSFKTGYSSMDMSAAQATDFLKVFGPVLRASGLSTRVACCDTLGFNQLPGYANAIRADSAATAELATFTSHGYSGAPASAINSGGKPVWQSEWGVNGDTWNGTWDDGSPASGFTWAQRIHTGMTAANLSAFLYWWGISNTSRDSSLVGLNGTTLTPAKRYYAMVNYSRFIRPGAVRIAATTGNGNLRVSAYRNSDGSVIVVALNAASSATAATFSVANAGVSGGATVNPYLTNGSSSTAAQAPTTLSAAGSFAATVPARSLATYRIAGGTITPQPTTSPTTAPTTSPTTPPTTGPTTPPTTGPTMPPTTSPTTPPTTRPTTPPTTIPTTTPTTPPTSGCTAVYRVTGSWSGGFQADVTVTNRGSRPMTGWTVGWTLPSGQAISQVWNGTLTTGGSAVAVTNAAWNGTVAAGAGTSFGMIGSGPSAAVPTPTCTSP